jgi:anti-anti-sigma factor
MPSNPTSTILSFTIEHKPNAVIVLCHGKLLAETTDLLYGPVSQLMPDHKRIILDLAHLSQMDSMGLGVLVGLYVSAKGKGCTLELRNLGKKVRELLVMTNLLPVFSVVGESRTWM